jgi:hypothetical protein
LIDLLGVCGDGLRSVCPFRHFEGGKPRVQVVPPICTPEEAARVPRVPGIVLWARMNQL